MSKVTKLLTPEMLKRCIDLSNEKHTLKPERTNVYRYMVVTPDGSTEHDRTENSVTHIIYTTDFTQTALLTLDKSITLLSSGEFAVNGDEIFDGDIVEYQQASGGILASDKKTRLCVINKYNEGSPFTARNIGINEYEPDNIYHNEYTFSGCHILRVIGNIHIGMFTNKIHCEDAFERTYIYDNDIEVKFSK